MTNSSDAQISLSLAKTNLSGEADSLECSNPDCAKVKNILAFKVRLYEKVHHEVFHLDGIGTEFTAIGFAKVYAHIEICSLINNLIYSHFEDCPPTDDCMAPNCVRFKKMSDIKVKFYQMMHNELLNLGEEFTKFNFAKASGYIDACLTFENNFHRFCFA